MRKFRFLTVWLLIAGVISVHAKEVRTLNNGNLVLHNIPKIPETLKQRMNQYQNVRSASFVDWSVDGQSLYISTRFGDVSQIHRVEQPAGARYQMTFFPEPVSGITRQPESERFLFTMDAGGSEFSQVFSFDPRNGQTRMVSDGESRNTNLLWDNRGEKIAYQSTRRDGRSNDVWLMNPDRPEEAEVLVEASDGSWWGAVDFNQDDSQLLVLRYISANQSMFYRVNIKDRSRQLIAGSEEAAGSNYPLAFDDLSGGLFYLTDAHSEFTQLAWQGPGENAEVKIISAEIPWDVTQFAISDDGRRAAFATNADGISALYLLDCKTLKFRRVDGVPIGIIGNMDFNPEADRLAISLNAGTSPGDVHVLELGRKALQSGALTRWTFSEVGGLNSEEFIEPELVHYPTFDEVNGQRRMIPAFVYTPAGASKDRPVPVVVAIHGGPEGQSRPYFSANYQLWANELGAAVVLPNVRGSSGYGKSYLLLDNGFKREDSVRDIGALLDWIATRETLDAKRVAVFGGSYGGYMVLAAATHYSDRLKAAVDVVGISNFVTFLKNTQDYRRDLRRAEYGDERDPKMHDFLQRISPLNNIEKIAIPMFIVQGQNDPRVPVTEAEQVVAALEKTGQTVWYMNAMNEGHGYRKKDNRDIYQQAVVMFLKQYLVGEQTD